MVSERQWPDGEILTSHAEMDVDALGVNTKSAKKSSKKQMHGRSQKKIVKRKAKNSVVFPDIKAKWRRQAAQKRKT